MAVDNVIPMSSERGSQYGYRLTTSEKNAHNKKWYRDKINEFHKTRTVLPKFVDGSSMYSNNQNKYDPILNMKVNYDLFNNVLDMRELAYLIKEDLPFSKDRKIQIENRDIVSNRIKVIMGLEMRKPLDLKVVATNSEATTRKEQKMTDMIKEYVYNTVMLPIKKQQAIQMQQETEGRELSQEEQQQLAQKMEEDLKALTPPEILEYMERKHQDPAEVQAVQILEYLKHKLDMKEKFNTGIKQAALVAHEAYFIGESRNLPEVRVITDFTRASYDESPSVFFFEDGEFFNYEYLWTVSQMIEFFGDDLTNTEIDQILSAKSTEGHAYFYNNDGRSTSDSNIISVLHCTWKDFREICILSYRDILEEPEEGEEMDEEENPIRKKVVDDTYKINPEIGDIMITKEWVPESYEGYLINGCVYKKMRPIEGQYRDINNLHICKLSYYGGKYDATNCRATSIMDRGKPWLYYNNLVHHRLKKVMATDKGKKIAINYKTVPDTEEMTMTDFFQNAEDSPYMMLDPTEEGNNYNDLNNSIRVIDLSMVSDINKYYEISERIKAECGEAMGVSRQLEAQIEPRDGAATTKQAMINNSYILEPFFNMHAVIKRNVLEALIEQAKITYRDKDGEYLSYVMDDMSLRMFKFDYNLLKSSSLGLFLMNDSKPFEIKAALIELAHAAVQSQQAKLSDVLTIMKEDSIENAEVKLRVAEKQADERMQAAQVQQQKAAENLEKQRSDNAMKEFDKQRELIILKEEERRKTEVVKGSIMGASFNPDMDKDEDGNNDFIEIARDGLDADITRRKLNLEEAKFAHQMTVDKKKLEIEDKKASKK